ncbi:MAG TPA: hypothetical protein VIF82_04210 [Burkholderiaceae bacterium]
MKKMNAEKNEQAKPASIPSRKKNSIAPSAAVKLPVSAKANGAAKPKTAVKPKSVASSVKKPVKQKATQAKPSAKGKAVPAAKEKIKKPKLIRDSFTMPEAEYAALGEVKKLCLKAGIEVKKSELLRIGVAHIRQLSLLDLKKSIASLVPLKAGRPKKEK